MSVGRQTRKYPIERIREQFQIVSLQSQAEDLCSGFSRSHSGGQISHVEVDFGYRVYGGEAPTRRPTRA